MLVLKRKEGQWVEVTHRSGDLLRIRVCRIEGGMAGSLNLAFDDAARNFEIERPERRHQTPIARPANPTVETAAGPVAPETYLQGYLASRQPIAPVGAGEFSTRPDQTERPVSHVPTEDKARSLDAMLAEGRAEIEAQVAADGILPQSEYLARLASKFRAAGCQAVVHEGNVLLSDAQPLTTVASLVEVRPIGDGYRFTSDGSEVPAETPILASSVETESAVHAGSQRAIDVQKILARSWERNEAGYRFLADR